MNSSSTTGYSYTIRPPISGGGKRGCSLNDKRPSRLSIPY